MYGFQYPETRFTDSAITTKLKTNEKNERTIQPGGISDQEAANSKTAGNEWHACK
jgi:hypothetical protein